MSEGRTTGARLLHLPWWVTVLLAVVCYCTLKYLVPLFQPANPTLAELARAAPFFAPIFTIPLLLLAAKQLYDNDKKEEENSEAGKDDNTPEK